MLPPVRTIAGSSGSYQNSSSVSAATLQAGEPNLPEQADADRDINPNHAGKLNVLLLSSHDGVAEGLSMLADMLGQALNIPRGEGETSLAYVERMAQALKDLAPALSLDTERQLNQILRGVRLQAVIDAFANPAGPEAARLVALLETIGLTESDLAASIVLTSYQQNSGTEPGLDMLPLQGPPPQPSGTPAPQLSPDTLTPAAVPAAAASSGAAAPLAPHNLAALPHESDQENLPAASPAAGIPPAIDFPDEVAERSGLLRFHHESDNIFSRTTPVAGAGPTPSAAEATSIRSTIADLETLPVPPRDSPSASPAGSLRGVIADARTLQSVLASAFQAGESTDPLIQARAAIAMLAGNEPTVPEQPLVPIRDYASRPVADYGHGTQRPLPQPRPENFPSIYSLKGWTEGPVAGLPLLPASKATEDALAAAMAPHAGPEPDFEEPSYHLRGRGTAANDLPAHKPSLSAAEQQLLRNADEAAGFAADRRMDTAMPMRERSATEAMLASVLQLGQDLRTGIVFAAQPYPVKDERDEAGGDRAGYRSSREEGEDEGDGDADDFAGDPRQDAEEAGDEGAFGSEDGAGAPIADPAYDLYQRMAGWS